MAIALTLAFTLLTSVSALAQDGGASIPAETVHEVATPPVPPPAPASDAATSTLRVTWGAGFFGGGNSYYASQDGSAGVLDAPGIYGRIGLQLTPQWGVGLEAAVGSLVVFTVDAHLEVFGSWTPTRWLMLGLGPAVGKNWKLQTAAFGDGSTTVTDASWLAGSARADVMPNVGLSWLAPDIGVEVLCGGSLVGGAPLGTGAYLKLGIAGP